MKLILAVMLVFASQALAQRFSFGLKGGTPLSDASRSALIGGRSGYGPWSLSTRRYTVGGTVEVAVALGLRVEVDALYKRTDTTQSAFFGPTFGSITRLAANSWEFPMLLKYRWRAPFRPFVVLGGTFRRIQGYDGSTETFAYGFNPPYFVTRYRIEDPLTQGGIAGGAGVYLLNRRRLKITAEVRYTRWTSLRFLPARDQVEILLGVGM